MSVGLSGAQPERHVAEVGDVALTSDNEWVALDFETATGRRASAWAVSRVPGSATPPTLSFGRAPPQRGNVTRPRRSTSTSAAIREPRSPVACSLRWQA